MTATLPSAPPSCLVRTIGRAAALPGAEWDRLARRGLHGHRFFAVAEELGREPAHVGAFGAEGPRVIVPAYRSGASLYGDLHDRWLGPAAGLARVLGLRLRPTLSVGDPFGTTSDPIGNVDRLTDDALDQLLATLEEEARAGGAKAVVWPVVSRDQPRLLAAAERRGYARLFAGSSARLPVPWSSFDEYLDTRSKSVRRTIRAELKALADGGLRTTIVTDFRAEARLMDGLYRASFLERNGVDPPLGGDFFGRLAEAPAPGTWAHLTWRGDALVGTSLNVAAGGVMDGGLAGFAPGYRPGPVYFNDLVYEPVRVAIRDGVPTIDLGSTALHAKLLRGAVLYPRFTLVRGLGRGMHALLTQLGRLVGARNAQKERRALRVLAGPASRRGSSPSRGE